MHEPTTETRATRVRRRRMRRRLMTSGLIGVGVLAVAALTAVQSFGPLALADPVRGTARAPKAILGPAPLWTPQVSNRSSNAAAVGVGGLEAALRQATACACAINRVLQRARARDDAGVIDGQRMRIDATA